MFRSGGEIGSFIVAILPAAFEVGESSEEI
jgi:hypothetical protein